MLSALVYRVDYVIPAVSYLKPFCVLLLFLGQVKFKQPPFFCPVRSTWRVVSETDGPGMHLYMFRGQARPARQGSSSHQQLTSTSSSGHVQRHNPGSPDTPSELGKSCQPWSQSAGLKFILNMLNCVHWQKGTWFQGKSHFATAPLGKNKGKIQ